MDSLSGKVAFITGGSRGIGLAIARALLAQGAAVAITGTNRAALDAAEGELRGSGAGEVMALRADVRSYDEVEKALSSVSARFGGVDILINNAGGADEGMKPWLETEPAQWQATFEQNIFSTVRLIRELAPQMQTAGWGRIIQIGRAHV